MSTGGAGRTPWAGRRAGAVAVVVAVALVAGCGASDFPNNPRPPTPAEVTGRIDSKGVTVSPERLRGGLVNFTVLNLSNTPVQFTIEGTNLGASGSANSAAPGAPATNEIEPGGTGSLKVDLKEGRYKATAGGNVDLQPAVIQVGPERKTSQNQVLLP